MAFSRPFLSTFWISQADIRRVVPLHVYYNILHLAILTEELKRTVYYGESSYNTRLGWG